MWWDPFQPCRRFPGRTSELVDKEALLGDNVTSLARIWARNRWPGLDGRSWLDAGEKRFDRVHV